MGDVPTAVNFRSFIAL